jgi:hypothetical protein
LGSSFTFFLLLFFENANLNNLDFVFFIYNILGVCPSGRPPWVVCLGGALVGMCNLGEGWRRILFLDRIFSLGFFIKPIVYSRSFFLLRYYHLVGNGVFGCRRCYRFSEVTFDVLQLGGGVRPMGGVGFRNKGSRKKGLTLYLSSF